MASKTLSKSQKNVKSRTKSKKSNMSGKEILLVAEALSNERRVDKDRVLEAIRESLEVVTLKQHAPEVMHVNVTLDYKTGEYQTFRYWEVVDLKNLEDADLQISLTEANKKDPSLQLGERLFESMPSVEFGRIAAQTAKQLIAQKMREAERENVESEYAKRVGSLLNGIVKKNDA